MFNCPSEVPVGNVAEGLQIGLLLYYCYQGLVGTMHKYDGRRGSRGAVFPSRDRSMIRTDFGVIQLGIFLQFYTLKCYLS